MLGILKAGGAYLPIDSMYPPVRVLDMLEDARPVAMLTSGSLVARLADAIAHLPVAVLDVQEVLADSRAFVTTLEGLDPADPAFAQLVSDRVAAALEANPAWRVTPAPAAVPAAPQAAVPGQPYAPAVQAQPYTAPPLQAPAIPASGPQGAFTAAPPGPRQLSENDALAMSPAQVQEAINKGLFVEAGFGPNRKAQR